MKLKPVMVEFFKGLLDSLSWLWGQLTILAEPLSELSPLRH